MQSSPFQTRGKLYPSQSTPPLPAELVSVGNKGEGKEMVGGGYITQVFTFSSIERTPSVQVLPIIAASVRWTTWREICTVDVYCN